MNGPTNHRPLVLSIDSIKLIVKEFQWCRTIYIRKIIISTELLDVFRMFYDSTKFFVFTQ